MKPSESLDEFLKLYWDDLTPEHINYLSQTKDEVAKLEAELAEEQRKYDYLLEASLRQIDVMERETRLEKALKYCQDDKVVMQNEIDVLKDNLQQAQAELEQWRAENLDGDNPSTRPMTRLEHRWMDEKKEWTAQLVTAQDQLEQSRQREARLESFKDHVINGDPTWEGLWDEIKEE